MSKPTLRIQFVDFSSDFDPIDNLFYNLLKEHYQIIFSKKPDILFFSNFGYRHLLYNCKKIFYTGENRAPNYDYCDYSFTFFPTDDTNYYLPHFVEYPYFFELLEKKNSEELTSLSLTPKSNFCNFIASNDKAKERIRFVQQLTQHKTVDCLGSVLFNMQNKKQSNKLNPSQAYKSWRIEKLYEICSYRFTIAFENECSDRYITEKIFQPFCINSIPIYWGSKDVNNFFNPNCFINVNNFNTFDDAIEFIIKVENSPDLYHQFFKESPILDNSHTQALRKDAIYNRLQYYIMQPFSPNSIYKQAKHYVLFRILHGTYSIKKLLHRMRKWITK